MSKKKQKYNISDEGRKTRQRVGSKNLGAWQKDNPAGGRLSHGANSQNYRRRFDDRRTRQGKALAAVVDDLIAGLGGPDRLTPQMRLIIDTGVRPKLITLICINEYLNGQEALINDEGELIGCLGKSYIGFSNALRQDIATLNDMAKPAEPKRVPTIEELTGRTK